MRLIHERLKLVGGTMLSNLVSSHDAAAQDAMRHITEFSQQAGDMDVKQVVAESARAAIYQIADLLANVRFIERPDHRAA